MEEEVSEERQRDIAPSTAALFVKLRNVAAQKVLQAAQRH